MSIMLERTEGQLADERRRLLADVGMDEQTLRERAEDYHLSFDEALVFERVQEIAFLLGED